MRSIISTTLRKTVTLGSNGVLPDLLITAQGDVAPRAVGADGIDGPASVAGVRIVNDGHVSGAASGTMSSGGSGIFLQAIGEVDNAGGIVGGAAPVRGDAQNGSNGGTAVLFSAGGTLDNTGSIAGGDGGGGRLGGHGGAGAYLYLGNTVSNSGTIDGGTGGFSADSMGVAGAGGAGLYVYGTATVTNSGAVVGGAGGASHRFGGSGGAALVLDQGILTNTGTLIGGAGGDAMLGRGGQGGSGTELARTTVSSGGTFIGGAGGTGQIGGAGGAGLTMYAGTLVADGTYIGGAGGAGTLGDGVQGAAINLLEAGTIVVQPSAVFVGVLESNPFTAGALQLAGTAAASFSTTTSGFGNVAVLADADWTIAVNENLGQGSLGTAGRLSVTGTISTGNVDLTGSGVLDVSGSGAIHATQDLLLSGGTLDVGVGGKIVVGTGKFVSALVVERDGAVNGYGTLSGDTLLDLGTIRATQGGTLTFASGVSGIGTVAIDDGGVVRAEAALTVAHVDFMQGGSGTLQLGAPTLDHFLLSGFTVGDTVDLLGVVATNIRLTPNDHLVLYNAGHIVDELTLAGTYTAADFAVSSDGSAGTNLNYLLSTAQAGNHGALLDHVLGSHVWH